MPTLAEAIRKNKNPAEFQYETVRQLVRDLENLIQNDLKELKEQAQEEIKDAIAEIKDDLLFQDVEPAKEVAARIASQEISGFKSEIRNRLEAVLKKIDEKKEELFAKVEGLEGRISEYAAQNEEQNVVVSEHVSSLLEKIEVYKQFVKNLHANVEKFRGPQGIEGPQGPQGPMGIGLNGKDGSPDTPEEVVAKVNSASSKVSLTSIEGLMEEIASIKRAIRERGGGSSGGGGMGNWTHQQFSTSSATTTVTLSSNVAANSTALLVRYNGQLLAHGVQYTISGKTITFTFTLDDSSNVDVTYVRT